MSIEYRSNILGSSEDQSLEGGLPPTLCPPPSDKPMTRLDKALGQRINGTGRNMANHRDNIAATAGRTCAQFVTTDHRSVHER